MRRLRVVFGQNGRLPTLLFAAIVPLGVGCGGDSASQDGTPSASGAAGTWSRGSDSGGGGGGGNATTGANTTTSGTGASGGSSAASGGSPTTGGDTAVSSAGGTSGDTGPGTDAAGGDTAAGGSSATGGDTAAGGSGAAGGSETSAGGGATGGVSPSGGAGGSGNGGSDASGGAIGKAGRGGATVGGSGGSDGAGSGGVGGEAGAPGYQWSQDDSTTTVPDDYPYPPTDVPVLACSGPSSVMYEAIVPLPPEGTPAMPGELCEGSDSTPLDSGWAARVTLRASSDRTQASGTITIAAELASRVVATPSVRIVDMDDELPPATLGTVAAQQGTYRFDVTWAESFPLRIYGVPPRIVIETRFSIDCDGGETRDVRALTALYFCTDQNTGSDWASSGDTCVQCATICEMAPSPSAASSSDETTALSGTVDMRVRVIGQVHGALVLLAEHNGGSGRFDYDWQASGGKLLWTNRDVALWMPPPHHRSPELVQVAAHSDDAAAVASMRWGIPA